MLQKISSSENKSLGKIAIYFKIIFRCSVMMVDQDTTTYTKSVKRPFPM